MPILYEDKQNNEPNVLDYTTSVFVFDDLRYASAYRNYKNHCIFFVFLHQFLFVTWISVLCCERAPIETEQIYS